MTNEVSQPDSHALLALIRKVSIGAYALCVMLALAGLTLIIQKPVASYESIVAAIFTDDIASTLADRHGERIADVWSASLGDISWPYDVMVREYLASDDRDIRTRVLMRYLNERSAERERHILLLFRDQALADTLTDYVERDLARSGTVTIPILQSQVDTGTFAIAIAVALVALQFYTLVHRDYMWRLMRRRTDRPVLVNPSLLTCRRADLELLGTGRALPILIVQSFILYGAPFALLLIFVVHYVRVGGTVESHTRVIVACVIASVGGILGVLCWLRRDGAPEADLFDMIRSRGKQDSEGNADT